VRVTKVKTGASSQKDPVCDSQWCHISSHIADSSGSTRSAGLVHVTSITLVQLPDWFYGSQTI